MLGTKTMEQTEPQTEPQGEPQTEPQGEPQAEPQGELEAEPQGEPEAEPQGESGSTEREAARVALGLEISRYAAQFGASQKELSRIIEEALVPAIPPLAVAEWERVRALLMDGEGTESYAEAFASAQDALLGGNQAEFVMALGKLFKAVRRATPHLSKPLRTL